MLYSLHTVIIHFISNVIQFHSLSLLQIVSLLSLQLYSTKKRHKPSYNIQKKSSIRTHTTNFQMKLDVKKRRGHQTDNLYIFQMREGNFTR